MWVPLNFYLYVPLLMFVHMYDHMHYFITGNTSGTALPYICSFSNLNC
jgi:hypothetical protein